MYYNAFYDYPTNTIYTFDDVDGINAVSYRPYCWTATKEPTEYKTIFGVPVEKVKLKSDMKENSDYYETDVSPETRVLVDNYYDRDELPVNRIMCLDIEVSSEGGFADHDEADKPIISIATRLLHENKRVVFVLDPDKKFTTKSTEDKKYIVTLTENEMLRKFMAYFTMIAKPTVITGWYSFQFDIAYLYRRLRRLFSTDFANQLSPIGIVVEHVINFQLKREVYKGYRIAGIAQLDYIILYKKYSINDRPMYSLNYIAMEELKKGKVKYDGSLDDLYKTDINKFVDYNITDIDLVVELEEKLHYIEIAIGMCHKGCISYDNVYHQSKIIEGAFFVFFKHRKLVGTNKKEYSSGGFDGAFVKEPKADRYTWIYSCDLTSLYPSIIRTLNISPETKLGRIRSTNKLTGDVVIDFVNGQTKEISADKYESFIKKNNIIKSSCGVLYRSDKNGFIPTIIETWFNERVKYKKLKTKAKDAGNKEDEKQYDIKQYVTKILLNSVYGVLGLSSFRFYDVDNALSVTSTGQEIIKYSENNVNRFYKILGAKENVDHVIYADTDSLYVSTEALRQETFTDKEMLLLTRSVAVLVTKLLNQELKKFSEEILHSKNNQLFFNQEAICYSGLWTGKKKYALYVLESEGFVKIKENDKLVDRHSGFKLPETVKTLSDLKKWIHSGMEYHNPDEIDISKLEPKLKVKGLDTVKSDFPEAFKELLKDTLIRILKIQDDKTIRRVLIDFRRTLDDYDVYKIAIPKGVSDIEKYYDPIRMYTKGAPMHVKSAINYNFFIAKYKLNDRYRYIKSGDKVKFVKLKKNEFNFETIAFKDDVIPKELLHFIEKYIDRKAIFESVLFNKLQSFWDMLSWGNLTLVENKLETFF